jgi:hypothetical protein
MKHSKFKELLEARKKASNNMKQINSVVSYYSDALEQAKETGFQYDIDHARDRYTKYFDDHFYKARDAQKKANDAVIKYVDSLYLESV